MPLVSFARHLADLASAAPAAIAVTDDRRSVDRRRLNREAAALADRLRGLGAGPGDFVTIALGNGIEFVEAFIACWMIGAIPQPVSSKMSPIQPAVWVSRWRSVTRSATSGSLRRSSGR